VSSTPHSQEQGSAGDHLAAHLSRVPGVTLRQRVALASGLGVFLAVFLACSGCYIIVRAALMTQIDSELTAQQAAIQQGDFHSLDQRLPGLAAKRGGPAQYAEVITKAGQVVYSAGNMRLPASGTAMRTDKPVTVTVNGTAMRELRFATRFDVLVSGVPTSVEVVLARPLSSVTGTLSELRILLLLLCGAGVFVAVLASRLATRRVLTPLSEVTAVADEIARTDDLSRRLTVHADDEVGQLAARFNVMLEQLDASRAQRDSAMEAQRQLVADASHELRTPLTSLRTNVELLSQTQNLSEADRQAMLSDMLEQAEELSALMNDLIELARGDIVSLDVEDIRLDELVEGCVSRAQRAFPTVTFHAQLTPVTMEGIRDRLARAINNLIDNAALHSPPNGQVEVTVSQEGLFVVDHGGGIDPADLPHIFERFYRGAGARGRRGSGLGLAIVSQVADQHGGTVTAANGETDGAVFSLRVPTLRSFQNDRAG
jgi:two-component system, OmpR family, sensor histidine kinase MprB